MQSQIYRFRILRALANAVFEARDSDTDAVVTLYEWTPDTDRRSETLARLETMLPALKSEVFTVDASCFLVAATPAQAAEDLARLRVAGLFTGTWLNETRPPAPQPTPQPPPIPQPPPVPQPPTKEPLPTKPKPKEQPARPAPVKTGWSNGAVLGMLVVATALCLALGVGLNSAQEKARTLAQENGSLQDRAVEAERSKQAEVAAARDQLSAVERQMKPLHGVNVFRILNRCGSRVRIATRSLASNGQWVVQGWWYVQPQAAVTPVASPSADFFYYAEVPGGRDVWGDKAGLTPALYVSDSDFVYTESHPPDLSGARMVHPRHVQQTNADQMTLTCK